VDDVAGTKRYVLKQLLELSKQAKQEGSQLKALELLGKASGLFTHTDSKAEVTISSDQLKRELAGHLRLLRQRPSAVQSLGTITDVNAKTPTAV
jgi:transcriptional antiterminator